MVRMLNAGELAGAGLDVYEHEPQVNPKLLELDSVVLLPHMGSATLEGRIEMGEKVLINIKTFADGHKPPDSRSGAHVLERVHTRRARSERAKSDPSTIRGCGRP